MLGVLVLPGALPPPARAASGEEVPGRLVLELTDAAAKKLHAGTLDLPIPVGGEALSPRLEPLFRNASPRLRRYALLTFDAGRVPDPTGLDRRWLDALLTSPEVVRGEPDRVMQVSALPDDPYLLGVGGVPNQYDLVNPGGLSLEAWRAWPFVPAGRTVTVAIIDSGVDWRHPDLGGPDPPDTGVLWVNQAERNGVAGVDDDGNGYVDDIIGWDFVDLPRDLPGTSVNPNEDAAGEDNDPSDFAGHGTLVAGFVNALTDNGIGIAGAAPPARIMVLRAAWKATTSSQLEASVYMTYAARALHYAAVNGARVVNCSWDSQDVLGLGAAIDEAVNDYGVVVVGSAGNQGTSIPVYPALQYVAQRSDCLGVAGVLESGVKAGGSNFGTWIDVSAFYTGNPSTLFAFSTGQSTYGVYSGTSFAAPQVTAEAALLRAVAPEAGAAQVRAWVTGTALDLDPYNPTYQGLLGGGLADYAAAVQAAGGGWDRTIDAAGLTPFTASGGELGVAYRGADSVGVVETADGLHPEYWTRSQVVAFPPERPPLPAAVTWTTGEDLLLWRSPGLLQATWFPDMLLPGWPEPVPAGAGEPIVWGEEAAARIYVPAADSVVLLVPDGTHSPMAGSIDLPVSTLAVGQLDGDAEPELAGIDTAGTVHVLDPTQDGSPVTWRAAVAAGPLPPVIGEFDGAGLGRVVVAGPDTTQPSSRQVLHFLGSGGNFQLDVMLEAPPLTALSLAGFHDSGRMEAVAVDAGGGIHLAGTDGAVRSVQAGGPVAGEVLCADLDGDWESDLLALRRDGTLLAWDRNLVPLAGFPRRLPDGAVETPLVTDAGDRRYVVVADTAGGLWSLPMGPSNRPAPWPMARGNRGRTGFLDRDRAVPVEPALTRLVWNADDAAVCWEGIGLEDLVSLRVIREGSAETLWDGAPWNHGCAPVGERPAGEILALEGAGRSLGWRTLGRVTVAGPAGFRLAPGFPNPFTASIRFTWSGARGRLRVGVFDVAGRRVAAFEAPASAGGFTWAGSDEAGRSLPPGLYFVRADDGTTRKVVRVLKLPR
jgi:subtilisin family serine protease